MTRRLAKMLGATMVTLLVLAGSASAVVFQLPPGSPPGSQVNNDPAKNIDPTKDAGLSDVVGGSLAAGGINVPWAAFEQTRSAGPGQEIFVRSFKGGAWTTQGKSLNIDTAAEAEGPSIDFAGAGRTVPWTAWYEPSTRFGNKLQVFASRFCTAVTGACTKANTWVPEGQGRGTGVSKPPSLNINTDRNAENPAVAGGATVAGNDPVPWVSWEEKDGLFAGAAHDQIFVSKAVKNAALNQPCPAGTKPTGSNSVSLFCWQQVGLERLAKTGSFTNPTDPTLNIDPSRDGIEPDDAFTGPSDIVLWVVWYEVGDSNIGLANNDRVFAAKIVGDSTADGGFQWRAVGNGTTGLTNTLDNSGANHFGNCAASVTQENKCTLNKVATNNAQDPRVAAGSLTPGGATVPWVVWSEDIGGGNHGIFVSRLVGGDHFELFNGGNPVSSPTSDAQTPDITFSGNTPYISWIGGNGKVFLGHFEGTTFKLDSAGAAPASGKVIDFRSPISSGCTSNPFTSDGTACPGGAAGTPFNLFTTATSPQRLFADSLAPSNVHTLEAKAVTSSGATVKGQANPGGAVVKVHFQFGPTTAYGSTTADQRIGPAVVGTAFSAAINGQPPNTTIHYRAVASSDFTTVVGADKTFTTGP